jgi:hypothetical protein
MCSGIKSRLRRLPRMYGSIKIERNCTFASPVINDDDCIQIYTNNSEYRLRAD